MTKLHINEQSRIFYDQDETRSHTINSKRPMQYRIIDHTEISQNMYMEYPNSLQDIDVNTTLRSKPTRLNEIEYATTMLFGTAPLKARNAGPIDVESSLFHGDIGIIGGCTRPMLEEYDFFDKLIQNPIQNLPIVVEKNTRGGESTRNVYKNTKLLNK
jgi:hypothetical protein